MPTARPCGHPTTAPDPATPADPSESALACDACWQAATAFAHALPGCEILISVDSAAHVDDYAGRTYVHAMIGGATEMGLYDENQDPVLRVRRTAVTRADVQTGVLVLHEDGVLVTSTVSSDDRWTYLQSVDRLASGGGGTDG